MLPDAAASIARQIEAREPPAGPEGRPPSKSVKAEQHPQVFCIPHGESALKKQINRAGAAFIARRPR